MEIEAKFSIPDEQTFQCLLVTTDLAGFSLGAASVAELHDHYLDTADRAFLAAGFACRLRRQGDRTLATLKGLGSVTGAVHRRPEHEVELPGPLPPQDWPPGDARDLALRLCDDKPLLPLLTIEQTRHSRPLYERDRTIANVGLDRVRVGRKVAVTATYLELEVELLPAGREETLQELCTGIRETWGLAIVGQSKFERALALLDAETMQKIDARENPLEPALRNPPNREPLPHRIELLEEPGIKPDDPMSEAGRKIFRFHYQRMLYNEPGTRLGEHIDALHDMRVATRRMRAAFRVFGDRFEPKAMAPYLKGLKRTGRALGPVRDLDVFRKKVQDYLETLPTSQQNSLDNLLNILEEQREAARQRMIAYLDSAKYARFVDRFGLFVETEGMDSMPVALEGGEPRPYRVRHVAPAAIYERLAAVRAYDEWVSIPSPPPERLHALRITCKRLRYTLEFFQEVLGPNTKELIKKVVVMQDHLGALQDAVVASSLLRDYLTWGTWGHEVGQSLPPMSVHDPGVKAYLAAKEAELQHLLDTFPPAWQQIKETEFSREVAEAVAVL